MSNTSSAYQTSSALGGFVSFLGWSVIILSCTAPIFMIQKAGQVGLIAIPISIAISLFGLLLVVAGQSLHAQLATANYSKQILDIMKVDS
ncbi:hypothetical protein [Arenicella xantha]|uniref:Uncharacterized protein n=1 Tax=Arenicella xantha TaxID=644221 RepID=A0A395JIW0_9GAMM|nr:hypothetical protein [Arenicella xantha]RBP50611.1 hypothetical protein DFR28_10222 [Arenicella xantha]